jgi:hypothetical protein
MSEMPLRFVQAEQLAGDGTHGAHPAGTDVAGLTGLKGMEVDSSDVTDMLLLCLFHLVSEVK